MATKPDRESERAYARSLLDKDGYQLPLDAIKQLALERPVAISRLGYSVAASKQYNALSPSKKRQYHAAIAAREALLDELGRSFVEMHVQERGAYWALEADRLDFSPESLGAIDERADNNNLYVGPFKKDYVKKAVIPLLVGYVHKVLSEHGRSKGWGTLHFDRLDKMVYKPNCGYAEITPFAYIELCCLCGFRTRELFDTLHRVTASCH